MRMLERACLSAHEVVDIGREGHYAVAFARPRARRVDAPSAGRRLPIVAVRPDGFTNADPPDGFNARELEPS